MMKWYLSILLAAANVWATEPASFGRVMVRSDDGGRLSVVCDGRTLVSSVEVNRGEGVDDSDVRTSFVVLDDGSRVWNRWSEDKARRFRLEVAERTDGAVEITLLGEMDGESPCRTRILELALPVAALDGKAWEGVYGDQRSWRTMEGRFDGACPEEPLRYLACDGVVFDFNPLGCSDEYGVVGVKHELTCYPNSVRGHARIRRRADAYLVSAGSTVRSSYGGFVGAKTVIRRGGMADFDRLHARRAQWYYQPFVPALTQMVSTASCRIGNLSDGYSLVSVRTRNETGRPRTLSVSVNGRAFAEGTVPPGQCRSSLGAVRISNGSLSVTSEGEFLPSEVAVTRVLAEAEDFQVNRGFWLSDGYEPCSLYRNADVRIPFDPPVSTEILPLPRPRPSPEWLRDMRIVRILDNSSTFAEFDDPAVLERYLDRHVKGRGLNAVMLSGMLSRHTYFNHEKRAHEAMTRIVAALHRRGLKVIDHEDVSLLWNVCGGFRVLMNDPGLLIRSFSSGQPSPHYCIDNPAFKERYFAHMADIARTGVDVLQLDELQLWFDGCTCRHCRERFRSDTGWEIPEGAPSGDWNDSESPIRRAWFDWRNNRVAAWYSDLRRSLADIAPDILFSAYNCYMDTACPHPRVMAERGGVGRSGDILTIGGRALDIVGTESLTRCILNCVRAHLPYRRIVNTLGKPTWSWTYAQDWQNDYAGWAICELTGQSFLYGEVPDAADSPDYCGFDATRGRFRREGAEPVAEIGILFSVNRRDRNDRGGRTAYSRNIHATAQALDLLHVPYEFVDDAHRLTSERLKKYKLLYDGSLPPGDAKATPSFQRECMVMAKNAFDADAPEQRQFLEAVRKWSAGATWWKMRAPEKVYAAPWREKDGTLVVQFFNATGANLKLGEIISPRAPENAFPPIKDDIVLTVPEPAATRAWAASPDFNGIRALPFVRNADGTVTATIRASDLKAYLIVRFDSSR